MLQPWLVELISVVSNVVVGLSALTVAIIAIIGLSQWKAELTGRTKFEIARKMAVLAFEFRDRYKRARNPFTFLGESSERKINEKETREETDLLNEYYARRKRLEPLQDTLSKLYEANWEAEVVLDDKIGKLIQPLEEEFSKLFSSLEAYFGHQHSRVNRSGTADSRGDWLKAHYKRIYGIQADDFSKAIDVSTQSLVDTLKTYLK